MGGTGMNKRLAYRSACLVTLGLVVVAAVATLVITRAASATPARTMIRSNSHAVHAVPNPRTRTRSTTARSGQALGTGDLSYWGGQVEHYPSAYVIFWGSSWSNGSGGVTKPGQIVESYFQHLGYTGYDDILTQYADSTFLITNFAGLGGSWVDTSNPGTDTTCTGLPTVEDSAIQTEITHAISVNGWPTDGTDATYFVFTPNGDTIHNSSLGCAYYDQQFGGFCGYHGYSGASTGFAYAAIPYTYDASTQRAANCIESTSPTPNGDIAGDNLTTFASITQLDSATDPVVGSGWMDSQNLEIGDKCAGDFPSGATKLGGGTQFYLQTAYSNAMHACESFARTWYFAEGYIGPNFTQYLTLENPTSTTANVSVQYLLGGGASAQTVTHTVPANSRVTVTVNKEGLANNNVSMVVTSDQPIVAERPMYFAYSMSGTPIPGGSDVLGLNQLSQQFTFGYLDTSASHDTYLTVLNPNPLAMKVQVSYYPAAGGTPTVINHTVNAASRGTIHVNTEGLAPGSYGAVVSLSIPGMVERPMYLVDNVGNTGSADVVGNVSGGMTTWNFAEGYTSSSFNESYILFNPGSSPTNATVTFYQPDGTATPTTVPVPAGGQTVVSANTVLSSNNVNNSATVTSSQPIIAERFMTFHYTGPVGGSGTSSIPGATDVMGSQYTSYHFQFAEGYTGTNFGEYLTLENPGSVAANVSVHYLIQGGGTVTGTYSVPAHSRYTVNTNKVTGVAGMSFSMDVTSDTPILAERPMYFDYNGSQTGGSDVIGFVPPTAA